MIPYEFLYGYLFFKKLNKLLSGNFTPKPVFSIYIDSGKLSDIVLRQADRELRYVMVNKGFLRGLKCGVSHCPSPYQKR